MSKNKYKELEPKLKTPAEVIDTLNIMKKSHIREMTWSWKDISLGSIKKRKLLKVCRKYGKIRRKFGGFVVRF